MSNQESKRLKRDVSPHAVSSVDHLSLPDSVEELIEDLAGATCESMCCEFCGEKC